jgi:replicative DNA helicase
MVEAVQPPPQAIESEQAVLGSLLLFPDAYDRIDWLKRDDFFRQAHRLIYSAIVAIVERGRSLDPAIVAQALQDAGELDTVGGRTYLGDLAINVVSVAGITRHAEIVRDKARLRGALAIAHEVMVKAYDHHADAKEIAEQAEASFLSLLDTKGGEEVSFAQAVMKAVDQRDSRTDITSTGLSNLDRMLKGGGMKPGQLIVIAGRPSMGKSALAWNIAEHVAQDKHVAGFSLEMDAPELADRSLTYHAALTDMNRAVDHLTGLSMSLDDTPAVTLAHIRLRSRRIKRKHGLGLIVVDYLQLMESKAASREQEIAKLSRGLKAVAKELHVPVIAVAQLNRGAEARTDKRPMLSDLRESGTVEQDADVVMMLYRDDYYNEKSLAPGIAEVLFRKQRAGKTGTAFLKFTPDTTRFHDYAGPAPSYTETQAPRRSSGRVTTVDFKSRGAGE